jgi:hypothetical protein
MPQNNVLPDWRATYPNDAPVQKPGGVTVATTATAPRVPNKPAFTAGTIQMVDAEGAMQFVTPELDSRTGEVLLPVEEQQAETEAEPVEEGEEEPEDEPPTTTVTRTTTRTTTRTRR